MLYVSKRELLKAGTPAGMSGEMGDLSSDDLDELMREIEALHKQIHGLQRAHYILNKANELLKER